MVPADLGKTLQDTLKGVFHWGSRFHAEKIGVIAGFVVLSVAIVAWGLSGPSDDNELGAEVHLRDTMVGFDLAVENTGSRAWRDVRITVDRKYLYTADELDGGDYVSLSAEDLSYAYQIPRPWGREDWEELADGDKPGVHPDGDFVPSFVQIRARDGRLDIEVEPADDY